MLFLHVLGVDQFFIENEVCMEKLAIGKRSNAFCMRIFNA
jgi:hypothetical protein